MSKSTVPVGPTTVVGWSTAALAFVGALVAYLTGDHSAQSVTAVESAVMGLLVLIVTQLGRYAQVRKVEAAFLSEAKPIFGEIRQFDPGVSEQVEAFVRAEIAKVEQRFIGKAPGAAAGSSPTSQVQQ